MKIESLSSKINYKNISHAYLFECDGSNISHQKIDNFIKQILCTQKKENFQFCDNCKSCLSFNSEANPDFLKLSPIGTEMIGIGTLRGDNDLNRGVINLLNETPLLSEAKVVKINNADLLTDEAQNYLLKILEEPSKNSYIFLISSRPYRLKKTILSRVTRINITPDNPLEVFKEKKVDRFFSELIHKEFDVSIMSEEELNFLLTIFDETLNSLETYNFSKKTIIDSWNDEYLNFRLNILKHSIFITLSKKIEDQSYTDKTIFSNIQQERLFIFLEELISIQALMANKVAINKKIQLDSIFDLV